MGDVDVRQVRVDVASDVLQLLCKALVDIILRILVESAEGVPPAENTRGTRLGAAKRGLWVVVAGTALA